MENHGKTYLKPTRLHQTLYFTSISRVLLFQKKRGALCWLLKAQLSHHQVVQSIAPYDFCPEQLKSGSIKKKYLKNPTRSSKCIQPTQEDLCSATGHFEYLVMLYGLWIIGSLYLCLKLIILVVSPDVCCPCAKCQSTDDSFVRTYCFVWHALIICTLICFLLALV